MVDVAYQLQRGLVSALKGDAGVAAFVGTRVWDEPPAAPDHPYVRIGNIEVRPYRTTGCRAWLATFAVESHSRPQQGRVVASRLGAAVIAALNENEAGLSVAGLTVSRLHFLTESTGPGRTERSKQSDALFEVVLDEAP
ncbi:DUF3168 domain-containing protein [Marinovum algicola]|uniref:DUF3168 domain-containing protein n=1 Tax=Marinovum algicola TaxID=42444 RepID=UPI003B5299C2